MDYNLYEFIGTVKREQGVVFENYSVETIDLFMCIACGSVVANKYKHDNWHDR